MTEGHGFRRTVAVSKIGDGGLTQSVAAKADEFAPIARYLGLVALKALTAELTLQRWRGKGVRLTGTFKADVVQTCVVTLEPIEAHIAGDFQRGFLPPEKLAAEAKEEADGEIFVDPTAEDPPEPLGREIDMGEILIEELALNLDPYPRKEGVEFHDAASTAVKENPFAVLAKLKPKKT